MRNDDLFVPETGKIARGIYPCHAKDLCDIFLSQIDTALFPSGRILKEEIEQIA